MIYLDNSATTAIDKDVLEVMHKIDREVYGNPSSVHRQGQIARKAIEEARESLAMYLGAKPREIVYTSSGSESNNLAIRGVMKSNKYNGNHIISTTIEHSSVKKTLEDLEKEGVEVTYLPVDSKGRIDLDILRKSIKKETRMISIIHGNNEIGTIQDIKGIGEIAKKHKIVFHVDAVQTFGKMLINPKDYNINLLSIAAHKIYGPKGIGALYIGTGTKVEKIITGGFQERNRRAGTENVSGICGFAKASEVIYSNLHVESKKEKELRDYFEEEVLKRVEGVEVNGDLNNRLFNISNLTIKDVQAESLLYALDLKGICISAGSACSSSTLSPSHVLEAIGLDKKGAKGTIRVSIGKYNTKEEIDQFVDVLETAIIQERNMADLY